MWLSQSCASTKVHFSTDLLASVFWQRSVILDWTSLGGYSTYEKMLAKHKFKSSI